MVGTAGFVGPAALAADAPVGLDGVDPVGLDGVGPVGLEGVGPVGLERAGPVGLVGTDLVEGPAGRVDDVPTGLAEAGLVPTLGLVGTAGLAV